MPGFIIPNRFQMLLLTQVDLSSVAPEGSAVRLINDLVDCLDTSGIERSYEVESEDGRPPFHPKTLVKVALLALHNCKKTRSITWRTSVQVADRRPEHRSLDHGAVLGTVRLVGKNFDHEEQVAGDGYPHAVTFDRLLRVDRFSNAGSTIPILLAYASRPACESAISIMRWE